MLFRYKTSLLRKIKAEDLEKYVNYIEKNSFEFNYGEFIIKEANSFSLGGFFADSKITELQVKAFLIENKKVLENISNEHIKKLKSMTDNTLKQ